MKHIMELSNDFIIKATFVENRKGNDVIDWVDKPGEKAHGKYRVDNVIALVKEYDEYGNSTNLLQQVFLTKDDLKKLVAKMDEIEKITGVTDYPINDLPY